MSPEEKKAVLDLVPYFSKNPIIFDVGSNKGEWADLLIDRCAEMHLFEPNELLLHYTMVKYCGRKNVKYCSSAMWSLPDQQIDFFYFTNENNGLSSVYDNPKWNHLPKQQKQVVTCTIDCYCDHPNSTVEVIDLLKIDVEGAELKVLSGASELLKHKKIKFIQVERAEHIHLSGYTFDDLINYLESFGYRPIKTEDTENVIFAMGEFTQDWNSEFKNNTQGLGPFEFVLEIGCFEGLTTCYIADNLLTDSGRIVCIDPLEDRYLTDNLDEWANNLNNESTEMFTGQYERFIRNTRGLPVELMRMKSIDAYRDMQHYRFDFIYVDGDHREPAVFIDAQNCFTLLKVGGLMLFDDYGWKETTAAGIDRFLRQYANKIEVLHKGYQVLIKKKENL